MRRELLTWLDRIPEPLVVLGVLLATTTPVRIIGRGFVRIDWEPTVVFIALALETLTSDAIIWVLTWVLYGSAFYYLLPKVYPAKAGAILRKDDPSRLVVTGGTVVTGMAVERSILGEFMGSPLPDGLVSPIAVLVVCGGLVPLSVFAFAQRTTSVRPDAVLRSVLELFLPVNKGGEEITGPRRAIVATILVAFAGVVFVWITFLVVIAALAAVVLFPLPEVLTGLGIIVVAVAPNRAKRWRRAMDVETRLLTLGRVGTYGFKGAFAVLLPVIGIGFAAIVSLVALTLGGLGTRELRAGAYAPGELLQSAVVIVAVVGAGWFALWYWLRVLDRLPHFIEAWNEAQPVKVETPEPARPFRARPPGLLVQPTLVFGILALPLEYPRSLLIVPLLLGVCAVMVQSVRWTRRIDPVVRDRQPPITDNWAVPAAFLVFIGGFGMIQYRAELVAAATGDFGALEPLASTGVMILFVVMIFYYADAVRPLMESRPSLTLRDAGRWIGLSAVAVAAGTVQHGPLFGAAIVVVLVIVAFVFS